MAIFPSLELEAIIQTNDKTRLDATKSFVSKDEAAITLVEIEPEGASGFVDVTGTSSKDWYLDWEYSGTSRTVTASIRITTDGAPITQTADIEVIIPSEDNLFSSDAEIEQVEQDILKWVKPGRNSFLNVHREAQFQIIDWLNDNGHRLEDGSRITPDEILDDLEVKKWSKHLTLQLIFEDLSNSIDDVFDRKSQKYAQKVMTAQDKSALRFDFDSDGTLETGEGLNIQSSFLVRR